MGGESQEESLLSSKKHDIISLRKGINFRLDLFGVRYDTYNVKGIKSSIRKNEKQIQEHTDKIANPASYVKDWQQKNAHYQKGLIEHWKKEIANFRNQIKRAKDELYRRERK